MTHASPYGPRLHGPHPETRAPAALGRLAARVAGLSGWRRPGLAFLAGAASVLALPPVHALPVLLLTFPVLLWLLDEGAAEAATPRRPGWRAFLTGWAFGFGFFTAGLYWIANALLIDVARFGWMIPFAVGGLGAVLAVYHGLTALALRLVPGRGVARVVAFAALWALMEALRGWALTGFPWNPLASVWMPFPPMVQAVAWGGAYGLSLLSAALFAMPAILAWRPRKGGVAVVGMAAVAAGVAVLGAARLPDAPVPVVEGVRLRLVQPAIPQTLKWRPELRAENLQTHIDMSRIPAESMPTHVIWGETALPFALDGGQDGVRLVVAEALSGSAGRDPAVITGVVRRTLPEAEPFRVWNSLVAIDSAGAVRGSYDKAHLVPFGEYVPFADILPLRKVTPGSVDFTPGPGPTVLDLPGLPPVSPLICYEVIFPGAVVPAEQRPAWMLNLTNDGWYGISSGPYQHLATTRLRAVEEGLPLVRVANTGISAIIDPWGRMSAEIGLGEAGIADGDLPQPLPPTLFARVGNQLPVGVAVVLLMACLSVGRRGRKVRGTAL